MNWIFQFFFIEQNYFKTTKRHPRYRILFHNCDNNIQFRQLFRSKRKSCAQSTLISELSDKFLQHFSLTCCQMCSVWKFDSCNEPCNGIYALDLFSKPWWFNLVFEGLGKNSSNWNFTFHVVISREKLYTSSFAVWTVWRVEKKVNL